MIDWEKLVEEFQYKPEWKFEVLYSVPRKSYWLVIRTKMLDSRGSGEMVAVAGAYQLHQEDFEATYEQALWRLRHMIDDMEQHEINEWFVHNGVRVYDPHKDD